MTLRGEIPLVKKRLGQGKHHPVRWPTPDLDLSLSVSWFQRKKRGRWRRRRNGRRRRRRRKRRGRGANEEEQGRGKGREKGTIISHTVINQVKPLTVTMTAAGIALTSDSRGYERHFHVAGWDCSLSWLLNAGYIMRKFMGFFICPFIYKDLW